MSLTRSIFVTWILAMNLICVYVEGNVSVEADVGTIVGKKVKTKVNNVEYTVKTFEGIPFGKAPVGELRFQKPVPMPNFETPFEAFEFGNVCQQMDYPEMPAYKRKSEDCLFLNVYVPDQIPDEQAGHAVMVWIHGGGLSTGAGQSYPGEVLSSFGNVIIVTINYRLNLFGFMDSQDGTVPGNLGLHDQHLAFKWVNKNIGAFGGDNTRVTIFGQSAGGSSVAFQAMYPANDGLFQRVIEQSGITTASVIVQPNPRGNILVVAKEVGCDFDDTHMKEAVACLKEKDVDVIMEKMKAMSVDPEKAMSLYYITSIDNDIIMGTPSDLAERSKSEDVEPVNFFRTLDFTTGFTNMDGGVFLNIGIGLLPVEDMETFNISREDFITKAIPTSMGLVGHSSEVIKSLLVAEYTDWSDLNSPISNRDQYVRLINDMFFSVGSVELARLHSNTSEHTGNTYTYVFSANPSRHILSTPTWIKGANHGDELGFEFLFDENVLKELSAGKGLEPIEDWEYELGYSVATFFTNFAKSGNPNKPVNVPVTWPRYEHGEQQFINLDKDMSDNSAGKYFFAREANLWLETIPQVTKALSESHDHDAASPFVKKDSETGSCSADGKCDGD